MNKIKCIFLILLTLLILVGCKKEETEEVVDLKEFFGVTNKYTIIYDGLDISPGITYDEEVFTSEVSTKKTKKYKVYQFDGYSIYVKNNVIYKTIVTSDKITTTDGIGVSIELNRVFDVYGEDYTKKDNKYIYNQDGLKLTLEVDNKTELVTKMTLESIS